MKYRIAWHDKGSKKDTDRVTMIKQVIEITTVKTRILVMERKHMA